MTSDIVDLITRIVNATADIVDVITCIVNVTVDIVDVITCIVNVTADIVDATTGKNNSLYWRERFGEDFFCSLSIGIIQESNQIAIGWKINVSAIIKGYFLI
ncbi:hypothetical protein [Nostoc sp. PCC 7107]|uniref:hypothetical protein n=1 Tax=Nostoc sp. PCC 7107 TaxID=317936 RepID=UPI0012F7E4C0|nr:hypothetical protein [Nostoc sp. PCC 7107]